MKINRDRAIRKWLVMLLTAAMLLAPWPVFVSAPVAVSADSGPALLWGPYLTATTATGITVNVKTEWESSVAIEYASEVYYMANGSYDGSATDGAVTQLHHIALSGLTPDTAYHYRVVEGAEAGTDFRFRTFPSSGPFTFVVISDTQDQLPLYSQSERYQLVAERIAAEPDVAFVLNCGDLVNNGNDLACWDRYFDAGRLMVAGTAVFPAPGNHDPHSTLIQDIFGLPDYYSFDCSDAHFTVLDTNSDTTAQIPWLNNDLQANKTWKFVSFHYPFYTSDPAHFGGWHNWADGWEAAFISNGVSAVFNGHIHTYERYLENGITYMVLGTGGGPLQSLGEDKYPGYQNSLEHSLAYARVTIDPAAGTATVQVIRMADVSLDNSQVTTVYPPETVFETFVIAKPAWDLNGDHVCNIGDVVVIGLHWGETGTPGWIPEDLNNDGVINIGDVVVIGLHWEEIW